MKFNKLTLGLAAVGVVSLTSAAQAEEKLSLVQSALSSTTISGYVDTSAQWNLGTGTGANYYAFGGASKADGFNLNVVQLSIGKALDEGEWVSGYHVDLWFGPDAVALATQTAGGDVAIRQAYVNLRMPVGNGIEWKMGVFDTIIGYESLEAGNNPNFTRSYGHAIEPTTHTGLLGTYKICDAVSVSAGVADTFGPVINARANPPKAESDKTYMASVALTAPDSWGWAKGSTLYAGFINGFASSSILNGAGNQTSWYFGGTLATPVAGLKCGAAFDVLDSHSGSGFPGSVGHDLWTASVYTSYQATEKLSFHGRGEIATAMDNVVGGKNNTQVLSLTGTVQYDLWKNVISRAEVRWDHGDEGTYFSGSSGAFTQRNSILVAANLIYKF